MKPFHELGARRIAEGVRARQFSARDVTQAFLSRVARYDEYSQPITPVRAAMPDADHCLTDAAETSEQVI